MNSKHCFFGKYCNEVVCGSKSTWKRLSDIKNKNVSKTCFAEAKTVLEVMLLRADLFYQHTFNIETAFVCDAHYNMLVQPSYVKLYRKCNACECIKGNSSKNKGELRFINISQAIALFEIFNMKNSYGKLICPRCRNQLAKSDDLSRVELHNDAFACLFGSESPCCMESEDLDYLPSVET